jgi:hypothetical protein
MSIYIDFNKSPVEYSVYYCRGGRTTESIKSVLNDKNADGWLINVYGIPQYSVLEAFFERWPDEESLYGPRYKYWNTSEDYEKWIRGQ